MKESTFTLEDKRFPASTAGSTRLPYLRPEMEAQHVELEMDCLAVTSGATATGGGSTTVTDWTDDTSSHNQDVSWP